MRLHFDPAGQYFELNGQRRLIIVGLKIAQFKNTIAQSQADGLS
jgi:hypothetical protein